jgi:hypothetical protein
MIGEVGHGARQMPAKSLRCFLVLYIDHEIPFAYERPPKAVIRPRKVTYKGQQNKYDQIGERRGDQRRVQPKIQAGHCRERNKAKQEMHKRCCSIWLHADKSAPSERCNFSGHQVELGYHLAKFGKRTSIHFSHRLAAVDLHCSLRNTDVAGNLLAKAPVRNVNHNFSLPGT